MKYTKLHVGSSNLWLFLSFFFKVYNNLCSPKKQCNTNLQRWSSATDHTSTSVGIVIEQTSTTFTVCNPHGSTNSGTGSNQGRWFWIAWNGGSLSMIATIPALRFGVVRTLISLHLHNLIIYRRNPKKKNL